MSIVDTLPVPQGWRSVRFGRLFERTRQTGEPDLPPLSVFLDEGVVPRSSRADNHNQLGEDLGKYLVVRPSDLVFNKLRTWQGGFGASAHCGIASPAYFVCRPTEQIDAQFADYLLHSPPYLAELTRISKWQPPAQFDLPWDQLRQLPILVPPRDCQERIVRFLQAETSRLVVLSKAIQEQQAALIEWENSRIDEALRAPTQVPLKALLRDACVGIVIQPARLYRDDGEIRCFRSVDLKDGTLTDEGVMRISRADHEERKRSELHAGDVVVVRTGQAGSAAVVPDWAAGANCVDLLILRPRVDTCVPVARSLCPR